MNCNTKMKRKEVNRENLEIIKNSLSNDTNGQTLVQNNNVTNNVQFVGTSADLAKLINEVKNENIADK